MEENDYELIRARQNANKASNETEKQKFKAERLAIAIVEHYEASEFKGTPYGQKQLKLWIMDAMCEEFYSGLESGMDLPKPQHESPF